MFISRFIKTPVYGEEILKTFTIALQMFLFSPFEHFLGIIRIPVCVR